MGYKLGYNNSDKYVACSNGIYYFIRRVPTLTPGLTNNDSYAGSIPTAVWTGCSRDRDVQSNADWEWSRGNPHTHCAPCTMQ